MDPNATLIEIEKRASWILNDRYTAGQDDAIELAELFTSLNEWLTKGGFKPRQWEPAVTAVP